jgi:putative membrane protein
MSDMYEKFRQERSATGQSAQVKGFGQMMVDAHSKTTAELTGLVASEKIKTELPAKLDSKHQKLIDDLGARCT